MPEEDPEYWVSANTSKKAIHPDRTCSYLDDAKSVFPASQEDIEELPECTRCGDREPFRYTEQRRDHQEALLREAERLNG